MTNPIRDNGYNKVTIDMGMLNCMNEPYIVEVGENARFILRYKNSARDDDYGKITLEAMAQ